MATLDFAWAQIGEPGVAPGVTVDFAWAQLEDTPVVATPAAPTAVSGVATGATTATITLTDNSGGTAAHRVQVRPVGGTFADAVGATNPMPAGTLTFTATGLAAGVEHETQVRAERTGLQSVYVPGAAAWWQDVPVGGGGELPTDTTSPTLTGTIAITALTSTSYTATCPAGTDAVGVTLYQWRLGGSGAWTTIPSGGRVISFTGRTPNNNDTLEMRCGDAAGNFSAPLSIGVTLLGIAPQVTTQPSAQSVVEGASFTFTAAFSGTPVPARQWDRNGALISGATGLSYTGTATLADNGAIFTCTAINSAGAITTNAVTLTVTVGSVAPSFVTQPASQTAVAGQVVTFTVAVAGTTPIAVQHRRNGVPIAGATGLSYSLTAQQGDNGATFDVVATNVVNSATSAAASLVVTTATATVGLDAFMPFVLPFTPGCPWELAEHHVRQACIEWFQRTLCWRVKTSTPTLDGIRSYTIPAPAGGTTAKLLAGWVNSCQVRVLNIDTGAATPVSSATVAVWTEDRKSFIVNPAPAAGGTVELQLAVKPSQQAGAIPESHFEQYAEHIAQGALARILKMSGKKWTDLRGAADAQDAFDHEIGRVSALVARGFGRSDFSVQPQWM